MTIKGYHSVPGFGAKTQKCGHDIPIEEYIANHKHHGQDEYPYCFCQVCNAWVSIDDAGYHK